MFRKCSLNLLLGTRKAEKLTSVTHLATQAGSTLLINMVEEGEAVSKTKYLNAGVGFRF